MKYIAVAVVSFGSGAVLGLSKHQADARVASLQPVDGRKGWYASTSPVQFKRGEDFQYEGELPKAIASMLEQQGGAGPRSAKPKAKGQTQQEAEAAQRAAQSLADQRSDLSMAIDELEHALSRADSEDDKAAIGQQLANTRAELAALG